MSGWQPIETAPKDGTSILAYVGIICDDFSVVRWSGEYWDVLSVNDEKTRRIIREFGNPTHWMPLPAPPG